MTENIHDQPTEPPSAAVPTELELPKFGPWSVDYVREAIYSFRVLADVLEGALETPLEGEAHNTRIEQIKRCSSELVTALTAFADGRELTTPAPEQLTLGEQFMTPEDQARHEKLLRLGLIEKV